MMEVFVARQPILDGNKQTFGYELLFRDGMSNIFPDVDGDVATTKVLASSFLSIGIENLTGGKVAFVNFSEELLVRMVPLMFPREKLMVEVLEDVEPGESVVTACRKLTGKGYRLALDDFSYKPDLEPLIGLAMMIKVDFMATPIEEIKALVDRMQGRNVTLLAEKVETHEDFQQAQAMGFQYFQGYFFNKPEIIAGRDIHPSRIALLRIIAEANRKDFSFKKLEKLIAQDVSTAYKLLRYINSSYFQRVQEISSIKQAIIFLGETEVRQFISLIGMAGLAADKPNELIRVSIIRARLCQLLGKASALDVDESELFTLGLFSLIDAIMDDDIGEIMIHPG